MSFENVRPQSCRWAGGIPNHHVPTHKGGSKVSTDRSGGINQHVGGAANSLNTDLITDNIQLRHPLHDEV